MPSFLDIKRNELTKSIELLTKQYTAVSNQRYLELNEGTKVVLQARLTDLEAQITAKQQELDKLSSEKPASDKPAAAPSTTGNPESLKLDRHQLYDILDNKFNIKELNDLYFRLDIEVEDVAPEYTQKAMAEELIKYCERHNLSEKLVETVLMLRSDLVDTL
jgi:hypothetical protein